MQRPALAKEIIFTPKMPDIPALSSYRGNLPDYFWAAWPYSGLSITPSPWINPDALVANSMSFPQMNKVVKIAEDLRSGVRNGAQGAGRLPLTVRNLSSFYEHGIRSVDTVAKWVFDELVAGPLNREDLPEEIRVSPLSMVLKPTGQARIIEDLSNPRVKDPDLFGSEPLVPMPPLIRTNIG